MRVAFLSYGYGRQELGLGKYSWHVVDELRKLGVVVDAFTLSRHPKYLGPVLFYMKNFLRNFRGYHIVHSSEGSGLLVNHPRMVETYHHDYTQTRSFSTSIFNSLEAFQCGKVRRIIVPSWKTMNALLRFGYERDNISVIYHGVDHETFRQDEVLRKIMHQKYGLAKCFVAISVGRLIKHKRHRDIVEALSKIPDAALILVGKGEEEGRIIGLAKKKGVKLLHFKDVSDEFLAGLYNAADVYVHASVLEGFGLTVVEAMACGLPIVCYDVADFKNIVGGAGFLLKQWDVEGIFQAIESLKENNDERVALGRNALRKSKAFTWKKAAEEHLKVYKKVLSRPN